VKLRSIGSLIVLLAMGFYPAGSYAQMKLGVGAPISGPRPAVGRQIKMGVEMAVEDINSNGGILGQQNVVSVGDDGWKREKGVAVAKQFVADGIKIVVGHSNSDVSIAVSPIYAKNGVLQISPGSTNPGLTEQGLWNVFRTIGRDDQQGIVAAKYIAQHFKEKTVALLYDETPYGRLIAKAALNELRQSGVNKIALLGVDSADLDADALASRLRHANVDFVLWAGVGKPFGLIVKALRTAGSEADYDGP
jgi:branched-chain amino acid transport system substrate-binding protein